MDDNESILPFPTFELISDSKIFEDNDNPFKMTAYRFPDKLRLDYNYVKEIIFNYNDVIDRKVISKDFIRDIFFNNCGLLEINQKKIIEEIKDKYYNDVEKEEIIIEDIHIFSDSLLEEQLPKETPHFNEIFTNPDEYQVLKEKYSTDKLSKLNKLLESGSILEDIKKKKEIIIFANNNGIDMQKEDLVDLNTKELNNIYNKIIEKESSDISEIVIIGILNFIEFILVNFLKLENLQGFVEEEIIEETSKFRKKYSSTMNFIDHYVKTTTPGVDIIFHIFFKFLRRLTNKKIKT